jgi:hypothetical protein
MREKEVRTHDEKEMCEDGKWEGDAIGDMKKA